MLLKKILLRKLILFDRSLRFTRLYSNTFNHKYDYDLLVIGGGSGGLACSKKAAQLGARVAVLDYVTPSPHGTNWGLGGTCVNVGCIPKKLMYHASLIGKYIEDSGSYGWLPSHKVNHNWNSLTEAVKNHVLSLNWGHRVQLKQNNVDYFNSYGTFVDNHTVLCTDVQGNTKSLTSKYIVIAVGGRPLYPKNVQGSQRYGITSDDLFFLKDPPGRTLVVGGSYVALECAGILSSLGYSTSLMIRSLPLKSFDQELAQLVVTHMENNGIELIRGASPVKVEEFYENSRRKLKVTYSDSQEDKREVSGYRGYRSVCYRYKKVQIFGRKAFTTNMKLDTVDIQCDVSSGRIVVNEYDTTSLSNVFAIGDVALGRPQLTPAAIMAGKLLACRLFNNSNELMDYKLVPTAVFTPLQYGAVGLSEQEAIAEYGKHNIEVFHAFYKPLEYYISERDAAQCYIKMISHINESNKVVGLHMTGPSAGDIIQGFAVAIKKGITATDIQSTVGIHPTTAEEIVKLNITKRSGQDPTVTAC